MECCCGKGELLRLDGGQAGLLLRCLSGMVWLTRGDGADYLVGTGQCLELGPGETALAEALQPSQVRLGVPAWQSLAGAIRLATC